MKWFVRREVFDDSQAKKYFLYIEAPLDVSFPQPLGEFTIIPMDMWGEEERADHWWGTLNDSIEEFVSYERSSIVYFVYLHYDLHSN